MCRLTKAIWNCSFVITNTLQMITCSNLWDFYINFSSAHSLYIFKYKFVIGLTKQDTGLTNHKTKDTEKEKRTHNETQKSDTHITQSKYWYTEVSSLVIKDRISPDISGKGSIRIQDISCPPGEGLYRVSYSQLVVFGNKFATNENGAM